GMADTVRYWSADGGCDDDLLLQGRARIRAVAWIKKERRAAEGALWKSARAALHSGLYPQPRRLADAEPGGRIVVDLPACHPEGTEFAQHARYFHQYRDRRPAFPARRHSRTTDRQEAALRHTWSGQYLHHSGA